MKNLAREDMPCWYDLSFNSEIPALLIKVHKDALSCVPAIDPSSRYADILTSQGGGKEIYFDISSGCFGIDGCIVKTAEEDSYSVFTIPIPPSVECQCIRCNGTGEHYQPMTENRTCTLCDGRKKIRRAQTQYEFTESVRMLLWPLESIEIDIMSTQKQLMSLQVMSKGLGGDVSPYLWRWLNTHGKGVESSLSYVKLPDVIEAMHITNMCMNIDNPKYREKDYYGACISGGNKTFKLVLPDRNAVTVGDNQETRGYRENQGYQFYDHNIDYAEQTIIFLAGIAKLFDLVRKNPLE